MAHSGSLPVRTDRRPLLQRRRCHRYAAAALLALGLLAACTDSDAEDQVIEGPSTSASTSTSEEEPAPETTTTTADAPASTTSTTSGTTTTTTPFDGSTERVEIPLPASTQEVVSHTGLGMARAGGEERITFNFDGALPGVVVEYVERPVRESGSGDEVALEGEAVLAIRFEPASSATLDGEDVTRTYTGPDRLPGQGGTIAEVVRTGDFEAVYEWVAGLEARVPFRVEVDEAAATVTVTVPTR